MWAGQVHVRFGQHVAAVGFDDEVTRQELERVAPTTGALHPLAVAEPALGVRAVTTGLRRRKLWLVHYGTAVRHRAASLEDAVRFVADFVRSFDVVAADGEVRLDVQVFTDGHAAVLVDNYSSIDLDERQLARDGITQVASGAAVIDVERAVVRTEVTDRLALRGVVLGGDGASSFEELRERLWLKGSHAGLPWAWLVDGLGRRILEGPSVTAIRQLFRR